MPYWDHPLAPTATEQRLLYSDAFKQIRRDDTDEVLGMAKSTYALIDNKTFGDTIDAIMGSDLGRRLNFDAVVSLDGGRSIAATILVDEPFQIPTDPSLTANYANFWTSHDGSSGLRAGASSVRIVCANTMAAADHNIKKHKFGWTIKHTANWQERVKDARRAMLEAIRTQEEWKEIATELVTKQISKTQLVEFIDKWIPHSTDMSGVQLSRVMQRRAQFQNIYENAVTTDGIRGNAYGVMQTAIEMADHFTRANSEDTRIKRQMLRGDSSKTDALRILAAL
jgi:phage/plasmid-like protein (TIGR03299 family)